MYQVQVMSSDLCCRQYAGVSRAPVDQTRYSEQASARSHSPGRYIGDDIVNI